MNFVAQVEDHLRDLGAEARKNHPGVKEASERAIIHLRSLQTQYVAAVRRAGASTKNQQQSHQHQSQQSQQQQQQQSQQQISHPTTALFQSQDVLRPFLLAANYPDASYELLLIALESIQLLLRGDAICPEDGIQISRVLVIQSRGCAGTLGLNSGYGGGIGIAGGGRGGGGGGDHISSSSSSVAAGGGGGAGSMAAGMLHAASSSVSGALGGITGMVLGSGGGTSADGTDAHHHHHQHYQSHRSIKEDESIALKIMQTITMLVDSRSVKLTQEVLGECLLMCSLLGAGQTTSTHDNNGKNNSNNNNEQYHAHATAPTAVTGVATSIRERFAHTAGVATSGIANAANAAAKLDGLGGAASGIAGNVKRAALATVNQLLSILFERAKDVMMAEQVTITTRRQQQQQQQQVISSSESSMLLVAERTLSDLCVLVNRFSSSSSSSSQSRQAASSWSSPMADIVGPFGVAAKEGLSPSPATSLALVDMVMKQICGDLFEICFDFYGPNYDIFFEGVRDRTLSQEGITNDSPMDSIARTRSQEGAAFSTSSSSSTTAIADTHITYRGVEFATRIISGAFQLGQSLLGSQYCYHVTKFTLESSLNKQESKSTSSSSPSDLMDFCLFYYTTSMVTTLLTHYLSSSSESFYKRFDTAKDGSGGGLGEQGSSVSNGNNAVTPVMSRMALGMMKELVSFVAEATEAYHKSDDFEDGYIFTQSERESFDIGVANSLNNHASSTRTLTQVPSPQPLHVSSIHNEILWRAFLALEVLHHVVSSHLEQTSWVDSIGKDNKNESFTASLIAVAASDFATTSASNREGILHLLLAAHADDQTGNETESNGEKISTSAMTDTQTSDSENSNAAAAVAAKVTDALVTDSVEIPLCDAGVTTWLAFKTVLSLVKSLKELAVTNETNGDDLGSRLILSGLVNGLFTPSVSMLQHFIRRMFGSPVIVTNTLSSYQELACASMAVPFQSTNERRQAILMSLCKLCLPSWGKRRPNCQLKESNIDSLWTMLWIIHSNYEKISDEWDIILSTLDQLAIVSISSPKLPASYSKKAAAIAGCFIRLPSFTTCFTHGTLSQFMASLIKLSEAVSFESLTEQSTDISRENSDFGDATTDNNHVDKESSIGGKLISWTGGLAGRAFGGGPPPPTSTNSRKSFRRSASTGASQLSKTYSEDLRDTACSQMGSMQISTPRAIIRKIPMPLLLVAVVAEANSYRLSVIEEAVAKHLCEIVTRSLSAELRSFAMEVLVHFMPLSLSESEISLKYGSGPLMVPDREDKNESPLEVHPIEDANKRGQSDGVDSSGAEPKLLRILCQTIQRTTQAETANTTLQALYGVLEGEGHNLSGENLITVIETLSVLSGCDSSDNNDSAINRSTRQWANVSTLAFQNLKLILDDFLEPMVTSSGSPLKSTEARDAILDCCVAFGRSTHDVNTSLTATGMLWSLADRDSSSDTLDIVLSKLAFLAMDSRPELRNCSVNTLFSCVVGLGEHFTDDQWEKCLNSTIFGVMTGIASAIKESENKKSVANGGTNDERYKVAVHHSRDSASKQWATTQILVLRGLERVLRLFFSQLLVTLLGTSKEPWFLQTWKEILRVSLDCATMTGEREALDMRLAGVEVMVLMVLLSCKSGMAAASTAARVGTNMEVVGGALRSVRAAVEDKVPKTDETNVENLPEVDEWRQRLFEFSFDNLCDFRVNLEQTCDEENDGPYVTIDSSLTQVLTKMTGELAKLYECCKNDEMIPGPCELQLDIFIENNDGYESRFLQILLEISNNAGNDRTSRYLNQVQRGVMSLLKDMASNSSLRAFKALITISGDYMFVRPKALSSKSNDNQYKDEDDDGEIFELEAAKMVASSFDSDELSNEAKVVVMCSVLLQYLKIYGKSENHENDKARRKTSAARYDIITSVIDSGLEATEHLDSNISEKATLDSIWDRIIATVSSLLLPPADNRYENYAHHSKAILNIVAIVLPHLPPRKFSLAETMLQNGANQAVEVAFECNEKNHHDGDVPYALVAEGAVHVFLSCFMGLCQKMPTCPAVSDLTLKILGGTVESEDLFSENAVLQSKTRQSLAIAVCESLKTTPSQDLLVGAFPLLCRLTNVENDGLRRAAGKILGGMNLSEAISRERQRAEQADTRAREIEEENIAMLEEIEYLQAENEELQRQLAVFSEEFT